MKKIFILIAPLLLCGVLSVHSEDPTPSRKTEVLWHTVTLIDYKPGSIDAAKAILDKFEAASKTADCVLPETIWFESGKYDLVMTWKLKDGPADLQDKWSPEGDTWWKALVAQEGSEEAAQKLQADYNALIENSVTSVSRKAK